MRAPVLLLILLTLAPLAYANESHRLLLKLSPSERNAMFTKIMKASDEPDCVVTETFFGGLSSDDDALWSVRCADKKAFLVTVKPDAAGSTKILECSVLKLLANVECFKKLK